MTQNGLSNRLIGWEKKTKPDQYKWFLIISKVFFQFILID